MPLFAHPHKRASPARNSGASLAVMRAFGTALLAGASFLGFQTDAAQAAEAKPTPQAAVPAGPDPSSTQPKRVPSVVIRPDGAVASPGGHAPAPAAVNRASSDDRFLLDSLTAIIDPKPVRSVPVRTVTENRDTREASVAPAGGYVVQVSAQRTEDDVRAAYRALQEKYPEVLGDRSLNIRRADLGDRGVYYRGQIGPFGTAEQANAFCGSLKAAGGQCIVQKN